MLFLLLVLLFAPAATDVAAIAAAGICLHQFVSPEVLLAQMDHLYVHLKLRLLRQALAADVALPWADLHVNLNNFPQKIVKLYCIHYKLKFLPAPCVALARARSWTCTRSTST